MGAIPTAVVIETGQAMAFYSQAPMPLWQNPIQLKLTSGGPVCQNQRRERIVWHVSLSNLPPSDRLTWSKTVYGTIAACSSPGSREASLGRLRRMPYTGHRNSAALPIIKGPLKPKMMVNLYASNHTTPSPQANNLDGPKPSAVKGRLAHPYAQQPLGGSGCATHPNRTSGTIQ
jgi:hypothetical protein